MSSWSSDRGGTGKPFSWPECRKGVLLLKGSIDKLQTFFFLNSIRATIATLEGAHGEVVQEVPLAQRCLVHKEPLIVYCFNCGSLICSHCMVRDHNGHKFEINKVAAHDTRKKLM